MGRLVTLNQYLNALSERTLDNTRQLKRSVEQRRNGMEDLYGVCFSANGDASHPATFYISLSPDYVYLQRFAFKLVLKPFTSSVAGVSGGGSLTIDETSLEGGTAESYVISGTSTLAERSGGGITPNPHTHTASGSIGGLSYGIKQIQSTGDDWEITIDGVPIADYLCEQQNVTRLFDQGEGVYPKNTSSLAIEDMYDILDVASIMIAEGEETNAEKILASGFKEMKVYGNQPFGLDMYLYMKFSNMNR